MTYQAICCVCNQRYGPPKTCDNSHGYCEPCATEQAKKWFPGDVEKQNKILASFKTENQK